MPVARTIGGMVIDSTSRFGDRTAFLWKPSWMAEPRKYQPISYREVFEMARALASYLWTVLGLKRGERVAILSENRPQWGISYLAITGSGLVVVPVDSQLKDAEIGHILRDSEAKAIFLSLPFLDRIRERREAIPSLRHIICFDGSGGYEEVTAFEEILETHGDFTYPNPDLSPDELAAIIYTSGTTGVSKGVMLSHRNLTSNVEQSIKAINVSEEDRMLSILPLHHTFECTCGFLAPFSVGASVAYAESIAKISEIMMEVRPTVMLVVPAILERMYARTMKGIKGKRFGPIKLKVALAISSALRKAVGKGVEKRIFSEIHKRLGGSLRFMVSGGAPLRKEIAEGFYKLGLLVLEGYGLTEASPVVSVNREWDFKFGSVGLPLPGVEVRISDPGEDGVGEIIVKGENVMMGYYKNPERTAETIKDGWLYTGDLGRIDGDGFLYVTGRSKDVIVTGLGKNVYPEEVEAELSKSQFIAEVLVLGRKVPDKGEEVHAMVYPDMDALDSYASEHGVKMDERAIEELIKGEIRRLCRNLAPYKRVSSFQVVYEPFVKTTTMKIKREIYRQRIIGA
jgi:long-chain acyl-CoA synthetase